MGYLFAMAPCLNCRVPFSFNPDLVPSITVDGEREPICRRCVEWANSIRIRKGLPPLQIQPGAYEPTEAY